MFYFESTAALLSWNYKQARVFIYFISNKNWSYFIFIETTSIKKQAAQIQSQLTKELWFKDFAKKQ